MIQQLQLFVLCRTGEPADDYREYCKTEHWRGVSRNLRKRIGRCEKCGKSDRLTVHHKTYERIGAEHRRDLQVLCPRCHLKAHARAGRLRSPFPPENAAHWKALHAYYREIQRLEWEEKCHRRREHARKMREAKRISKAQP